MQGHCAPETYGNFYSKTLWHFWDAMVRSRFLPFGPAETVTITIWTYRYRQEGPAENTAGLSPISNCELEYWHLFMHLKHSRLNWNGYYFVQEHPPPHLQVRWTKDGTPLQSTHRHHMSFDGQLAVLRIANATASDSGLYALLIKNDCGTAQTSANVHVKQKMGWVFFVKDWVFENLVHWNFY